MNITTAISLINELVYFPGWKITATDHSMRFESTVLVRIDYPAQNTDRHEAREGYPTNIVTYATFPIVVGSECDGTVLYRKVLNAIDKINSHEAREALRVMPTYWAPFHPHRVDGMKRWIESKEVSDDSLLFDLQFGIG